MRSSRIAGPLAIFLIVASTDLLQPGQARAAGREMVAGQILVGVPPERDTPGMTQQLFAGIGVPIGVLPAIHTYRVRTFPGMTIEAAITRLTESRNVRFAEPIYPVYADATPNDSFFAFQYGPQTVHAASAWEIWRPKARKIIAIVDTGIDGNHPDLTRKMTRDAMGTILGYNAQKHLAGETDDDNSHGTHCAGIAAAQINNGLGIAGISGWTGEPNASDTEYTALMPIKVLDRGGRGDQADVAEGILWAVEHGADVISTSLGYDIPTTTLGEAVAYAWQQGCVLVASAGNNGNSAYHYPASFQAEISVASTDPNDRLAASSTYGPWVRTAAPGVSIYATVPGGYGYKSGTSMACPHVAGEAALLWAHNPQLTNADVVELIVTCTDPYLPFGERTIAEGAGRINVSEALLSAGP